MNCNEMHPTFWNSLTLIDRNFGTKSPIELKQKNSMAKISQFLIMLISHFSIADQNFGIWKPRAPPLSDRIKATVSYRWDWSGLPCLVDFLTWLQVSECRIFWNTEKWLKF